MMDTKEREEVLNRMQAVSNAFYREAIHVGNHPFIEFCGFMNEYIKMAQAAHSSGQDFTEATEHNGIPLPMAAYNAEYLGEKFACIFGPTFRANPEMWEVFQRQVMKSA